MSKLASPAPEKMYPKVKDVLLLLAGGTFIAACLFIPGLPIVLKPYFDEKRKQEENEWKKFNSWRLKFVLKRLHGQKLVEIDYSSPIPLVKISEKGKKRLLTFNVDKIELKKTKWDGKWRIILYDIFSLKKEATHLFRKTLKRMNFLKLQKSVYITPYVCYDEIEYLRQICDINKEVLILTVSGLENEIAYKEYFGLV